MKTNAEKKGVSLEDTHRKDRIRRKTMLNHSGMKDLIYPELKEISIHSSQKVLT